MREKFIFIIDICIFYDNIFVKKRSEKSMIGVNDILKKIIFEEPLTEEERFKILRSKRIEPKVVEYLMEKLNNLYIEVLDKYKGSLFELMKNEKLEGWCWQTTESAIVFLNDDDYIERGNLKFDERTKEYYHSWICFNFDNEEYVLDPCLNLLCKKSDYSKIFEVNVKGKVSAIEVKKRINKTSYYTQKRRVINRKKEYRIIYEKNYGRFL